MANKEIRNKHLPPLQTENNSLSDYRMSETPAISIRNLKKTYAGPKGQLDKEALKGINFDVMPGEIFGLLGPNGAGKSTLINILAGLVDKTEGEAEIWGFNIDANRRNASRSIGIVPQEIVFDPFFTPFEVLENQAGFMGSPNQTVRAKNCWKQSGYWKKRRLCPHSFWRDEKALNGRKSYGPCTSYIGSR